MTTTILLVRHAHVHNPGEVIYGRLPRFRLSDLGRLQAEALRDALSSEPVQAIYTSPLLRARQTARTLAEAHPHVRVRTAAALIELKSGYQGAPHAQLPPSVNYYEPVHAAGDESVKEIWRRVSRFIHGLVRRHAGRTALCVSHGDPIMTAIAGFSGLPLMLRSIRPEPNAYPQRASVTRLTFESGGELPLVTLRDVIAEVAPGLSGPPAVG